MSSTSTPVAVRCYRPSGRFKPTLWPWAAVAMVGAALITWPYEQLLFHIPFIYVNFLLVAALGAVLGLVAGHLVKHAEMRSPQVAYAVGLLLALTGLATSYGWNLMRFVNRVVELHPELTRWQVATEGFGVWLSGRVHAGWRLNGSNLNGPWVWFIWASEAAAVLWCAWYFVKLEAHQPYCERCQRWMSKQSAALAGLERSAVAPLLERGDLLAVVTLNAEVLEGDAPAVALQRAYCPGCSAEEYLTVSEVSYTRNRKNELQEQRNTLAASVVLPPEARLKFLERFGAPPQSAAR